MIGVCPSVECSWGWEREKRGDVAGMEQRRSTGLDLMLLGSLMRRTAPVNFPVSSRTSEPAAAFSCYACGPQFTAASGSC